MRKHCLLAWSVRRELWENRAVYFAPLAVAVLAFAGFLFHEIRNPAPAFDVAELSQAALSWPLVSDDGFRMRSTR